MPGTYGQVRKSGFYGQDEPNPSSVHAPHGPPPIPGGGGAPIGPRPSSNGGLGLDSMLITLLHSLPPNPFLSEVLKNLMLSELKEELCASKEGFCRECFKESEYRQNPPNVFRDMPADTHTEFFFVFDKPNTNEGPGVSDLVPITILDPRDEKVRTRKNLVNLFEILSIDADGKDRLSSRRVHITNAVKCDKCAETGKTGRIRLKDKQVRTCLERFLFKELEILQPTTIVFFGTLPERYVLGANGKLWDLRKDVDINGRKYRVVRVPHTAPISFNTYGRKGEAYKEHLGALL